jgi:hypothetical protein
MGERFGYSKEELDKRPKKNWVKLMGLNPYSKSYKSTWIERKARRLLSGGNVSLVEAKGGFLTFEIKSLIRNDYYIATRTRLKKWTIIHHYKDKDGVKQSVMRVFHKPESSAYLLACIKYLEEYQNG